MWERDFPNRAGKQQKQIRSVAYRQQINTADKKNAPSEFMGEFPWQ